MGLSKRPGNLAAARWKASRFDKFQLPGRQATENHTKTKGTQPWYFVLREPATCIIWHDAHCRRLEMHFGACDTCIKAGYCLGTDWPGCGAGDAYLRMAHPRVVSGGWAGYDLKPGPEAHLVVMDCGSGDRQCGKNDWRRRKNTCIIWGLRRSSCPETTLPCSMHPKRSRQRHHGAQAGLWQKVLARQSRAGVSSAERTLYDRLMSGP